VNRITLRAAALCAVAGGATAACNEPDREVSYSPSGVESPPPRADSLEPGALATVRFGPVEGWTGPGGRPFEVALRTAMLESSHARRFGVINLSVVLRNRSAGLTQYPCTSCHQGRRVMMTDQRVTDAHQNIQPRHPAQIGALCGTCHRGDDVARFVVQGGPPATLDQSYRLCAQCHFAQVNAWAGGGHGKRLDGWLGRRVVMACTDCHDPHAPAAVSRIPFRAPVIERTRGSVP